MSRTPSRVYWRYGGETGIPSGDQITNGQVDKTGSSARG